MEHVFGAELFLFFIFHSRKIKIKTTTKEGREKGQNFFV